MLNPSCNETQALKLYFQTYWMKKVGISIFSVFDVNIRTNNSCEGFHNRFNRFMRKRKPNIWVFLKKLLQENATTEIKINKLKVGQLKIKSKTSKYIHLSNSIEKMYKELDKNQINLEAFLMALDILQRK